MPSSQKNGSVQQINNSACSNHSDMPVDLVAFLRNVDAAQSAQEVIDALHSAASASCSKLRVLGAVRLPLKSNDWGAMRLGRSVFLHADVPDGWWDEYAALAPSHFPPALFLARSSLATYTWTETRHLFQPAGVDRWGFELALKYGMRDGIICPVGGRWLIAYWSKQDLANSLDPRSRIVLQCASGLAVQRLEDLTAPDIRRIGSRSRLTARELAVLRQVSDGRQSSEIAEALGLGEETVRSHLKKAQRKLGARNRVHAACDALRQNLIP